MKQGPLDAPSVKALIRRVASGLSAAHELGVIHRDLSPDNVVLPDEQRRQGQDHRLRHRQGFRRRHAARRQVRRQVQLRFARAARPLRRRDHRPIRHLQPRPHRRGGAARQALDMGGTHAEVIDKRRAVPDLSRHRRGIRPVIAAMLAPDPAVRPKTMQEVVDLLAAPPAPTAKPMPGPASDDPWGEPRPSKTWRRRNALGRTGCRRRHGDRAAAARTAANEHAEAPARGGATVVTGAPVGAAAALPLRARARSAPTFRRRAVPRPSRSPTGHRSPLPPAAQKIGPAAVAVD